MHNNTSTLTTGKETFKIMCLEVTCLLDNMSWEHNNSRMDTYVAIYMWKHASSTQFNHTQHQLTKQCDDRLQAMWCMHMEIIIGMHGPRI